LRKTEDTFANIPERIEEYVVNKLFPSAWDGVMVLK
jgi:hypothetical protein